jgi:hypothetical protein
MLAIVLLYGGGMYVLTRTGSAGARGFVTTAPSSLPLTTTTTAFDQLAELKDAVTGVGQDKNLGKQVKKIEGYVATDNTAKACKELKSFIKKVNALAASTKISAADAATIVDLAKEIEATIGC